MDHILSIKLKELGNTLRCEICKGFPVDAVTISECLDCYCKSCIVLYVTNLSNRGISRVTCPVCGVVVDNSRPFLGLKPDHVLQTLLYKINTGMFFDEMQRRRNFFAENPVDTSAVAFNLTEEDVGQIVQSSWMPKEVPDMITVVLYYDSDLTWSLREQMSPGLCRRQEKAAAEGCSFHMPAMATVGEIRKMISFKYRIDDPEMSIILDVNIVLEDGQSLNDIIRFREKAVGGGILNLTFVFLKLETVYRADHNGITAFVNGLIFRKPALYIKPQKRSYRRRTRCSGISPPKEDHLPAYAVKFDIPTVKRRRQMEEIADHLICSEGPFPQLPKQIIFRVPTPPTNE